MSLFWGGRQWAVVGFKRTMNPQVYVPIVKMLEHETQPSDRCDAFPAATSRVGKTDPRILQLSAAFTQIANQVIKPDEGRAALGNSISRENLRGRCVRERHFSR